MEIEDLNDVPGFSVQNADLDFEDEVAKKTKKNKKSGGFQAMGLGPRIMKGIVKRGYNIPTPIQRKTIPLILEGRDVVAMAKTGSGKTACFLIPLFEKLKQRVVKNGARALILSPTRELAIQTFKFIKDLGKFTDLKTILVLGGDSMDSQFSAIHTLPDVIVATPGRFLHLCVEMELKLTSIEYVVMDEADRLFEMGFGEQLNETLKRLPSSRQMVLFSATLPKQLVEFAKAGLSDPVLIRLDVESKIPDTLDLKFIYCRPDERYATLLALLRNIVPHTAQTVVFAGTQHHVELISLMLTKANISNTFIYSSLDASARKINTAKFTTKKVKILVVTDVAARGIDIPSLDYVVNLHFPGKPKLFIHRVGRCARAGRSGTAYSIFSNDDVAHLIDLHLFLNRPLEIENEKAIGTSPSDMNETEHQLVLEYVKHVDLATAFRVSNNAYKQYIATRPVASSSSNKRAKNFKLSTLKILKDFADAQKKEKKPETKIDIDEFKTDFLSKMKNYRAKSTIFELNPKSNSKQMWVMTEKRGNDAGKIEKHKRKMEEMEAEEIKLKNTVKDDDKKPIKKPKKDAEHYIEYQSKDHVEEDGYAINSFTKEAKNAEFTVAGDTAETMNFQKKLQKWDRKKKKMVNVDGPKVGKIRTEHGVWIPASYKTDRYDKWRERSKVDEKLQKEDSDDEDAAPMVQKDYPKTHWGRHNAKEDMKKLRDKDILNPDQIVKKRMFAENKKTKEAAARLKNLARKKRSLKMKNKVKAKGKSK